MCKVPVPIGKTLAKYRPEVENDDKSLIYGAFKPFQISATEIALSTNRKKTGTGYTDFEDGADLFIVDSLEKIESCKPIKLMRNTEEDFQKSDGSVVEVTMVHYPGRIGFVPLGALLEDGTPHPHAGTGFAVLQVIAFEKVAEEILSNPDKLKQFKLDHREEKIRGEWPIHQHLEVHQYKYDGKDFVITSREKFGEEGLLPPEKLGPLASFRPAIPDGEDMLLAMIDTDTDNCGVARWRCINGKWQATEFVPITNEPCYEEHEGNPRVIRQLEPSVQRSLDGSLWFTTRYGGNTELNFILRLWQSKDNGKNWQEVLPHSSVKQKTASPTTLNRTSTGQLYLAANQYPDEPDPDGIMTRRKLVIWAVDEKNKKLSSPEIIMDAKELRGNPEGMLPWWVDHPVGEPVRLADGKWHDVIAFRVQNLAEVHGADAIQLDVSGAYLQELESGREVSPPWKFE